MILLILKTYLYILLFIVAGSFIILFGGLYFILRSKKPAAINVANGKTITFSLQQENIKSTNVSISSQDINAIAGDDVMATQLDLARAYIESGRQTVAKKILLNVAKNGKVAQQKEAENLLLQLVNIRN